MYHKESNHPILLEVSINDCNSSDQVVKRFIKKFKKFRIMDELKEHTHFVKPSEKKRLARKEGARKQRKQQREFEEKNRDK